MSVTPASAAACLAMPVPEDFAYLALALIVGCAIGYAIARALMTSRLRVDEARVHELEAKAQMRANEVLDSARKDAERIAKDAELRTKDDLFHRREEFNREMETARVELREHERRLEKREDA